MPDKLENNSVTIILADDHTIIRDGLRNMLTSHLGTEIEIIGEAQNGREAITLVTRLHPDLVIMDISMPDLNGIDATTMIAKDCPDTKVIALSMHTEKSYVLGMIKAGARGYILKDCAVDELITAIEHVMQGNIYITTKITSVVIEDYLNLNHMVNSESSILSTREREVLQLLAEGYNTKQIAAALFVSPKTIEAHRKHIMDKLKIYSVADLTKFAIREGITSLDD